MSKDNLKPIPPFAPSVGPQAATKRIGPGNARITMGKVSVPGLNKGDGTFADKNGK